MWFGSCQIVIKKLSGSCQNCAALKTESFSVLFGPEFEMIRCQFESYSQKKKGVVKCLFCSLPEQNTVRRFLSKWTSIISIMDSTCTYLHLFQIRYSFHIGMYRHLLGSEMTRKSLYLDMKTRIYDFLVFAR